MIENQLFYSLIAVIFVGGAAGYIGSLMVTKRMALVGDALGHIALPGVAIALLFNFDVVLGALASLLVGILLIWFLGSKTGHHIETLTGIIFVVSLAVALLIIPNEELELALIGDIAKINFNEALLTVFLSVAVIVALRIIFSKIILITFSEDLALAQKINVKKYNLIYLLLIGVVVALGIKIIGSLLIGALIIIPASSSRNLGRNMSQYSYGAAGIGVLVSLLGVWLFGVIGYPVGPMVVLVSTAVFLITLIFKKK